MTEGHPQVTDAIWLEEEAKHILYSLEKSSEHPLAEAVVKYLKNIPGREVKDFGVLSGKGVEVYSSAE